MGCCRNGRSLCRLACSSVVKLLHRLHCTVVAFVLFSGLSRSCRVRFFVLIEQFHPAISDSPHPPQRLPSLRTFNPFSCTDSSRVERSCAAVVGDENASKSAASLREFSRAVVAIRISGERPTHLKHSGHLLASRVKYGPDDCNRMEVRVGKVVEKNSRDF